MKNTTAAPTKFTTANADLGWGPRPGWVDLHPICDEKHFRSCAQCKRGRAWTKAYMAKVNGR